MSRRSVLALAVLALSTAACATGPVPGGYGPPPGPALFRADDFAWSQMQGRATVEGRVDYQRNGQAARCTGSAGLTPVTPYTRARFLTLYGSTERAAVPAAIVRARTVPDPNADYRSFVRSVPCSEGRFEFTGLPDGQWFVIVPVEVGGESLVLMRSVATRGGRVSVSM